MNNGDSIKKIIDVTIEGKMCGNFKVSVSYHRRYLPYMIWEYERYLVGEGKTIHPRITFSGITIFIKGDTRLENIERYINDSALDLVYFISVVNVYLDFNGGKRNDSIQNS